MSSLPDIINGFNQKSVICDEQDKHQTSLCGMFQLKWERPSDERHLPPIAGSCTVDPDWAQRQKDNQTKAERAGFQTWRDAFLPQLFPENEGNQVIHEGNRFLSSCYRRSIKGSFIKSIFLFLSVDQCKQKNKIT